MSRHVRYIALRLLLGIDFEQKFHEIERLITGAIITEPPILEQMCGLSEYMIRQQMEIYRYAFASRLKGSRY